MYSQKNTILRYSLYGLAFIIGSALSLLVGIRLQTSEPMLFAIWIGAGLIWLIAALLYGISLRSTLLVISTFFIKPYHATFIIVILLLCICFVAEKYKSRSTKIVLPYSFVFLILLTFGLIGLLKTYVPEGYLYFASTIIVPIVAFFVIANSEYHKDDLYYWTAALVVSAIILSLYGVAIALRHPANRIGATWSNAMTINGFYTVAFFFSIAHAFVTKKLLMRFFWVGSAFVIFLGMIYTYTRIVLVAVLFGLLMLMLKVKRIRLLGILAIGMIPLIIPSSMTQRLDVALTSDMSLLIRLIIWYKAYFVILQHPLTGIGFSTWSDIYHGMVPAQELYAIHAHNIVINLMLEIGIIGFIAYFVIIIKTLRDYFYVLVKPNNDIFHYTLLVAILSLLVSCITDIFIQQYEISIVFWITLALFYQKIQFNKSLAISK